MMADTLISDIPDHEADRRAGGLTDGLLRVSVGLEGMNDLVSDFGKALNAAFS